LLPHQSFDPVQPARYSFSEQIVPDTPGPVGSIAGQRWAQSSFGGTTSARSSVMKMASGLSEAAMTVTLFGRDPDLLPVQSLSETPKGAR
jgi:hypothetical protein